MDQAATQSQSVFRRVRLQTRYILHALRHAWLPALVSAGSLWLLGLPGLAYFQVQQALLNTLSENTDIASWLPIIGSVASIILLAITLSAWSARLIPNFYGSGQRSDVRLLGLVLLIGMGPPIGFALCTWSIAALPDQGSGLQSAARKTAAAIIVVGALSQLLYYWLALHQRRRRSRNILRYLPLALYLILFGTFLGNTPTTVAIARGLGPVALFAIALSAVVAGSSFLLAAGRKTGIPWFWALLAWVVVLNYYDLNDGHPLGKALGQERFSDQIDGAYHKWAGLRPVADAKTAPLLIVTAEGGGIRAAFMTGMVLAMLADRCPVAANRIFAISGVSGGSIGAAAYVAAVHAHPLDLKETRCDLTDRTHDYFESRVRMLLAADHLSDIFAKTLFTEPVQAVLPFASSVFDRQLGLNESIRADWERLFDSRAIDDEVFAVVPSSASPSTPYLITNTTNIEHGERVTIGAMHITGARAANVSSIEHGVELSFLEAATTSARFPFVSPPGLVLDSNGDKLRYTDGGVYDNSGTLTASDIYDELASIRDGLPWTATEPDPTLPADMPILVLNITNTATCWNEIGGYLRWPCARLLAKPTLHALTDTVDGLFAVRDAHTVLFKEKFYREILAEDEKRGIKGYVVKGLPGGGVSVVNDEDRKLEGRADKMLTFALHSDINVPLGWMLSGRTAGRMDQQIFKGVSDRCIVNSTALGYEYGGPGRQSLSNGCAFAVLQDYFNTSGFQLKQAPVIGF